MIKFLNKNGLSPMGSSKSVCLIYETVVIIKIQIVKCHY